MNVIARYLVIIKPVVCGGPSRLHTYIYQGLVQFHFHSGSSVLEWPLVPCLLSLPAALYKELTWWWYVVQEFVQRVISRAFSHACTFPLKMPEKIYPQNILLHTIYLVIRRKVDFSSSCFFLFPDNFPQNWYWSGKWELFSLSVCISHWTGVFLLYSIHNDQLWVCADESKLDFTKLWKKRSFIIVQPNPLH